MLRVSEQKYTHNNHSEALDNYKNLFKEFRTIYLKLIFDL
jgi:hypothetical protein